MSEHTYTNKLIHEKSPYLFQHAHNPVDWYPWGSEAFEKARSEDKMLFVSIGYATCHWCHVMERESFEDPDLAEYLNNHFVPVKVDREERPDVDKIHMDALHALGQQGGWPLNMFVTPEGKPVTGGTYFPPRPMYGRKSFGELLRTLVSVWDNERDKIYTTADQISSHLQQKAVLNDTEHPELTWQAEEQAVAQFRSSFDTQYGGFSHQPQNKFPPSMGLMLLLRHHHRTGDSFSLEMVEKTLKKMYAGGIYDQLGGGLSRYSTDYKWLVPHFEKMLYDNALFVWALIETFQITKNPVYETAVRDVLSYIEKIMTSSNGAFFSAEDADSEGVEGKFYLWSKAEVMEILGIESGELACTYWDITENGNFEGRSIPNTPRSDQDVAKDFRITVEELQDQLRITRKKLMAVRTKRIRPLLDNKVLTSWNALMISAFARAARVFGDSSFEKTAERAATFIFKNLKDESGRLLRRWFDGEARYPAYLCDYAQMTMACLDLYETTYDPVWFRKGCELSNEIKRLFRNENGPFYDTGKDGEVLLTRNAEGYDGVEPSGNSSVANVFLRLNSYGLESEFFEDAQRIFRCFSPMFNQAGVSFCSMLSGLHFSLLRPKEVVISGRRGDAETEALLSEVRREFHPNTVTAFLEDGDNKLTEEIIPLASGRPMLNGRATAYVCQNQACRLPVHTVEEFRELLDSSYFQN